MANYFVLGRQLWNGEHRRKINIDYNKSKTFRHIFSIFVCVSGVGLLSGGLFAQGVNVRVVNVRGVNVLEPFKSGSKESGNTWSSISMDLNAVQEVKITTTQKSIRDLYCICLTPVRQTQ